MPPRNRAEDATYLLRSEIGTLLSLDRSALVGTHVCVLLRDGTRGRCIPFVHGGD